MSTGLLERLETELDNLPEPEQRMLLEHLARRLHVQVAQWTGGFATDLDAMARDPEIQYELVAIEHEFRATDADGLEIVP